MDELEDDLQWHALNYRTAAPQHAEQMWQELVACVQRKLAAERDLLAALELTRGQWIHSVNAPACLAAIAAARGGAA